MNDHQEQQAGSSASLPSGCWYAIALASHVSTGTILSIPFQLHELVATRNQSGQVLVRKARCAHRGCSLRQGWIENGNLTCPYHGWQYDDEGQCVHIPALRPEESIPRQARVGALPSVERHGLIWVWLASHGEEPTYDVEEIPELERMNMVHQPRADISYHFNGHYSRSIENGIDPTHAPFTHGKSIGRVDTSVDLTFPKYDVEKKEYAIAAKMPIKVKKLNGLAKYLLKGDESEIYKSYRFIYPNLLLSLVNFGNYTMVALQAHVPTGEHSALCLNTNYRNFLNRTPGLARLFNRITINTGNKIMLEDDAIIKDQEPKTVGYKGSNEILIESDKILITFRKMMSNKS